MIKNLRQEALEYHKEGKSGKFEICITKPFSTQKDLSLAYTPGVAEVCKEIAKTPEAAYDYTAKGNLVAVITNGTAVLGLGDIGALASKPVMEGKAILFKRFAGLDSFDIEVDEQDPKKFIEIVKSLAPTFGGINLEDIKAPECFEIEAKLKELTDIPVMHDDQHGTAIVTAAGMMNACEISGKKIEDLKVVIVGSGAAAIASARMYRHLGVAELILIDSKGVVHKERKDINLYKKEFAYPKAITRAQAFEGADMVLGLSRPGSIDKEDIARMKEEPFVFVCANPTPEIAPALVRSIKPKAILATGRSDYPNQVNNVLAFPYLFRGAIDARSRAINYEMMIATAKALAKIAKEPVPKSVEEAYGKELVFGPDYIIPTPFDPRLIVEVSSAVMEAAIASAVARKKWDISEYKAFLKELAKRRCAN